VIAECNRQLRVRSEDREMSDVRQGSEAEICRVRRRRQPDFNALMDGQRENLCAWCFDLLELNGQKQRKRALIDRKAMLRHLLIKADDDVLRCSEEFVDAEKLLAVATKQGLEGIVSKKTTQPYVSGRHVGWIKVQTATWHEANKDRWEIFERRRPSP